MDTYFILVLNGDMKIDIAELNWYQNIEDYYYLCDRKFDSEKEALNFITSRIFLLPEPHPI